MWKGGHTLASDLDTVSYTYCLTIPYIPLVLLAHSFVVVICKVRHGDGN